MRTRQQEAVRQRGRADCSELRRRRQVDSANSQQSRRPGGSRDRQGCVTHVPGSALYLWANARPTPTGTWAPTMPAGSKSERRTRGGCG